MKTASKGRSEKTGFSHLICLEWVLTKPKELPHRAEHLTAAFEELTQPLSYSAVAKHSVKGHSGRRSWLVGSERTVIRNSLGC